mgnify:CR=1 FL=1
MVDPFTAFAAAQTAVAAIKQGIQLGKDIGGISADLTKFAGAVSDLDFAHRRTENLPWYAVLLSSDSDNAMDIFTKKKQTEALRAEIKQYIQFSYGQSAWNELLSIEAQVRKDRQATMYRKAEIKQTILEWVLGILVVVSSCGVLSLAIYLIGKKQGKW